MTPDRAAPRPISRLAWEFLARNQIESPRAAERHAAAAERPRAKGTFWPYS